MENLKLVAQRMLLIAALLPLAFYSTQAQDYSAAAGLRLGTYGGLGLSGKKILGDGGSALELNLAFRGYSAYNYVEIGGLYEKYGAIEEVDGLFWYAGGGLTVGFDNFKSEFLDNDLYVGLTGIVGVEYKLENSPITLGIDYMPTYFFNTLYGFTGNRGGFVARYTFGD